LHENKKDKVQNVRRVSLVAKQQSFTMSGTNNAVKGTTRVSNNDRRLMKDLWVAGKDNPTEKNRLKRKLTRTEKEARQSMPEERAEQAFKNLRKKQKTFVRKREAQQSDDLIALECIQQADWNDYCLRHYAFETSARSTFELQKKLSKLCRSKRKGSVSPVAIRLAEKWLAKATQSSLADTCDSSGTCEKNGVDSNCVKLLYKFKNKRFQNFAAKCKEHDRSALINLTDTVLRSMPTHRFRLDSAHCRQQNATNPIEAAHTNLYEIARHSNLSIRCDSCRKCLASCEAKTDDHVFFFHEKCARQLPCAVRQLRGFSVFGSTEKRT